jgi:hypothetical protein
MARVCFLVSKVAVVTSALLLVGACGGEDSTTLERCTPLSTQASAPIEFGEVVGIGRAEDGTLYAIDEEGSDLRVFVSDGDVLQRYVVDGSGDLTMGDTTSVIVTVVDLDLSLKVAVDADGNVRMGALYQVTGERDFEIGEQGEELEVLDASDIKDVPLRNLPGDITLEYWAGTEDGHLLLVTRPSNDWAYEDFRLFFGPSERIGERRVTNVLRERDGGTTTIEFLAGGSVIAYFPSPLRDADSTLSLGGEELTLTPLSSDPFASDLVFYCR